MEIYDIHDNYSYRDQMNRNMMVKCGGGGGEIFYSARADLPQA